MPKDQTNPNFNHEIFYALLCNDPDEDCGYNWNSLGPNSRCFGPDVTQRFLNKHKMARLIRSHEYNVSGFKYDHSNQCLTIFSCPNYWYDQRACKFHIITIFVFSNLGNCAAVALVDSNGTVKIEKFD